MSIQKGLRAGTPKLVAILETPVRQAKTKHLVYKYLLIQMLGLCGPDKASGDGPSDNSEQIINIGMSVKLSASNLTESGIRQKCSFFSVQPLCSLCLWVIFIRISEPQRHREHSGCTEFD